MSVASDCFPAPKCRLLSMCWGAVRIGRAPVSGIVRGSGHIAALCPTHEYVLKCSQAECTRVNLLRLSYYICQILFRASMLFCLSKSPICLLFWRPTYPAPPYMFPLVPLWERAQNERILVTFAAPSTVSLMRSARVLPMRTRS
jgi:hypothetical protein